MDNSRMGLKLPSQNNNYNVDDFNYNFNKIDDKFWSLDTTIANLNTAVLEIKATLAGLDTTVPEIQATLAGVNAAIPEVQTTLTELETSLSSTRTKVTSLETGLSSTQDRVMSLDASLSTTASKVTNLETSLVTTQGRVTSLDTTVSEIPRTTVITGLMTSNGAMVLGAKPRAVFVFATRLDEEFTFIGNAIAMAVETGRQSVWLNKKAIVVLNMTETGFVISNMVGAQGISAETLGSNYPLKYVAIM